MKWRDGKLSFSLSPYLTKTRFSTHPQDEEANGTRRRTLPLVLILVKNYCLIFCHTHSTVIVDTTEPTGWQPRLRVCMSLGLGYGSSGVTSSWLSNDSKKRKRKRKNLNKKHIHLLYVFDIFSGAVMSGIPAFFVHMKSSLLIYYSSMYATGCWIIKE